MVAYLMYVHTTRCVKYDPLTPAPANLKEMPQTVLDGVLNIYAVYGLTVPPACLLTDSPARLACPTAGLSTAPRLGGGPRRPAEIFARSKAACGGSLGCLRPRAIARTAATLPDAGTIRLVDIFRGGRQRLQADDARLLGKDVCWLLQTCRHPHPHHA